MAKDQKVIRVQVKTAPAGYKVSTRPVKERGSQDVYADCSWNGILYTPP